MGKAGWRSLVLIGAGLAGSAFGQDTAPPDLVGLVIDTPAVDTSAGPDTVRFTVQVADDLSGFYGDNVSFELREPDGGSVGGPFCRIIGGTPLLSTQQCSLTLPQFSEAGTWSIGGVFVRDAVGNERALFAADLRAMGFPIDFVNSGGGQDVTAPSLVDLVMNTPAIDTGAGPDTVRFTVTVADDRSGFYGDNVSFELRSPRGGLGGPFCRIVGGTPLRSVQQCSLTLPQYSEAGSWSIGGIFVRDAAGNSVALRDAELRALGFPIDFVNSASVQDVTAPNLVALVMDTPTIDTSSGPDTVSFTVTVTDDLSGFYGDNVSFELRRPSGGLGGPFCRIVGGAPLQSIQECSLTLPQYSEAGTWSIGGVFLRDAVGNTRTLRDADLRALGFLIEFVNEPGDGDGDGVNDGIDQCPATVPGAAVDPQGCGIAQLVPCAGPASGGRWRNHADYVLNVVRVATAFWRQGLITGAQKNRIVSEASRSMCGR